MSDFIDRRTLLKGAAVAGARLPFILDEHPISLTAVRAIVDHADIADIDIVFHDSPPPVSWASAARRAAV